MHRLLLTTLLSFLLLSCEKENTIKSLLTQQEIWDCHHNENWDSNSTFDYLIGEWQWIYAENNWHPDNGLETQSANYFIKFNRDSSLIIRKNDKQFGSTRWELEFNETELLYQFKLDSQITNLYGRILICNNIMECNHSYIDGSDNYFLKIIPLD